MPAMLCLHKIGELIRAAILPKTKISCASEVDQLFDHLFAVNHCLIRTMLSILNMSMFANVLIYN